jgi:thymidylate kinase
MKSLAVCFEGLPAAGKTTVCTLIAEDLRAQGRRVEVVDIDQIGGPLLEEAKKYPRGHRVRVALMLALKLKQFDKVQMLRNASVPPDVILIGSGWGATVAFEAFGAGVDRWCLEQVFAQHIKENPPDLTFYLRAPLETVLARRPSRILENLEFARRVWCGYETLSREERWCEVDATSNVEELEVQCFDIMRDALASAAL